MAAHPPRSRLQWFFDVKCVDTRSTFEKGRLPRKLRIDVASECLETMDKCGAWPALACAQRIDTRFTHQATTRAYDVTVLLRSFLHLRSTKNRERFLPSTCGLPEAPKAPDL